MRSAPIGAALEDAAPLSPDYQLGNEIGRGSFAVVLHCTDTRTGTRLAAKKLQRYVHGRLPAQQAAVVGAEAAAQAALCAASPSILRLVDVRQDDNYLYLIQELCLMDLAAWLQQRGGAPLSGREAASILRQLLSALAACHHAGIAFRDVKPANLLIREINANGLPMIVLADFGCCRSTADPPPASHASAGTPLYSSPESLHSAGGIEGDIWSAGVLLYHLLSGHYPFCDPRHRISQGEFWRRVAEAPIRTAGPAWHGVSPGAVALVHRMLDRDCSSRITAEQAQQDPWLLDMTSSRASDWRRAGSGGAAEPAQPQLPERMQAGKGMVGNVLPGMPASLASGPLHASV
ncbi:hypothetical protein ABPG75_007773 [Micractinium tetrahymenae]